jgi:hypothetical protein
MILRRITPKIFLFFFCWCAANHAVGPSVILSPVVAHYRHVVSLSDVGWTYVGHIATLISNLFSLFFAAGSWQLLQLGFGLTSNCVAVLLQLTHDTDSNLVSSNPVVLL